MSLFLELLDNIAIVLVHPSYPENIGFVARTALNMGISKLVVVCDDKPEEKRMLKTATHKAHNIIESIEYHGQLATVLADFHLVLGTTARQGRQRRASVAPRDIASLLAPALKDNRLALVFGPEDRGLTNEELDLCGYVTTIATADFTSLNLSHAVAIICHEMFQGLMVVAESAAESAHFSPRLATVREQSAMFDHFQSLFACLDEESGKETAKKRLKHMRTILNRRNMQAKESRFLAEICKELAKFFPLAK